MSNSGSINEEFGWRLVRFIPMGALADELFGGGMGGPSFAQLQEFLNGGGNRQRRASQDVIDKLPSTLLSETETCPVCQDDMMEEATKMPCDHKYHRDCIKPWLAEHNTCPMCRWEVDTDDAEYNRDIVARREQKTNDTTSSTSTTTTSTLPSFSADPLEGVSSSAQAEMTSSSALATAESSSSAPLPPSSPRSPRTATLRIRATRMFSPRSSSNTSTTTNTTSTTTAATSSPEGDASTPSVSDNDNNNSGPRSQVITFAISSSSPAVSLILLSLLSYSLSEGEEEEPASLTAAAAEGDNPRPGRRRGGMITLPLELLLPALMGSRSGRAPPPSGDDEDEEEKEGEREASSTAAISSPFPPSLSVPSTQSDDHSAHPRPPTPFPSDALSFSSALSVSENLDENNVPLSPSSMISGSPIAASTQGEEVNSSTDFKSTGDREVKSQPSTDADISAVLSVSSASVTLPPELSSPVRATSTNSSPIVHIPSSPLPSRSSTALPSFEVTSPSPSSRRRPRATPAWRTAFVARRDNFFRSVQDFFSRRSS